MQEAIRSNRNYPERHPQSVDSRSRTLVVSIVAQTFLLRKPGTAVWLSQHVGALSLSMDSEHLRRGMKPATFIA